MPETKSDFDPELLAQLGSPGLRRAGGYVYEERHPKLAGYLGARVYREMGDNDAVVGAVLYVIKMLCRSVEWRMERTAETPEAVEAEEFAESCRTDMSHTWAHFIAEVLSCVQYGWSYHETVYKIRRGPRQIDGRFRSRFNDGRIGWRKLDLRAQESLIRWQYDEKTNTSLRGLWQMPQDVYRELFVPIDRALLFRVEAPRNNPEGRSLLRTAYRSWWFIKRLEEIEAIGISRDMTGVPVATVPPSALTSAATDGEKQLVTTATSMVEQLHRDEREGIVWPAEEIAGPNGQSVKTGYGLKLMASGGTRQVDADKTIRRHQSRMAMTLLCEWLMLGADKSGSYSLIGEKTDLFAVALEAILDSVADVMNTFAIPRLMAINAFPEEVWPKLVHGNVAKVDVAAVATAINQLVGASVITPDNKLERKLREMMGLPLPDETEPEAAQAAAA